MVAGTAGNGIVAIAGGGAIAITVAGNVTGGSTVLAAGNTGNGIFTATVGTTNIAVQGAGTTVTGTGAGNSGVNATGNGGNVTIDVAGGTTVQGVSPIGTEATTANAITVAGTSGATVNVSGNAIGGATALGATQAVIALTTAGATTVNINAALGTVRSDNATASQRAGDAAISSAAGSGSVTVNNNADPTLVDGLPQHGLIGRVVLAGDATATDIVNIQSAGTWTVFSGNAVAGGAGGNTILNNGTIDINFNPVNGAFTPVGAPVQTVTNTGTFNVQALQPQVGAYNGALNFYGGNGSLFANGSGVGGGTINMQADAGSTKNAVTFNTLSMAGTSDLNYTYTWAGPIATSAYNFQGSNLNAALNGFVFDTSYHQGTGGALVGVDYSFPT